VTSRLRAPDFGPRAASYDRLRAATPGLDAALTEQGDLRGRRVLDIGCGTGRFAEARRVLRPDGRLVLATFDPASFHAYYLNRYFPSLLEIDLARFPAWAELKVELHEAGFSFVNVEPFVRDTAIDRETALVKIRGRHISTFDLIDEEEYRLGLERAEPELPERIGYPYELLIVTAAPAARTSP